MAERLKLRAGSRVPASSVLYEGYMESGGQIRIPRDSEPVPAWDLFTKESPGVSGRYGKDGKSVFDLPGQLQDWGMYFSEQREE